MILQSYPTAKPPPPRGHAGGGYLAKKAKHIYLVHNYLSCETQVESSINC